MKEETVVPILRHIQEVVDDFQHIFLEGCGQGYVESNAFGLETPQVLGTPNGVKVLMMFYVDERYGGVYDSTKP